MDQPDPGAGARSTPVLIPPSPAPKVRTMPAYCIAIGIGHRHEWRAESPVSSGGSGRGLGVSGLQPSGSIITSSTQAAGLGFLIVRLWRAGKGAAPHHGKPVHARPPRPLPHLRQLRTTRSPSRSSHPHSPSSVSILGSPLPDRGPTARPDISLWHRHRNWAPR